MLQVEHLGMKKISTQSNSSSSDNQVLHIKGQSKMFIRVLVQEGVE